jgi:hypothetical protein
MGVTLMRDEGESKECDRMRTLGEGVRGGAVRVAITQRVPRGEKKSGFNEVDSGEDLEHLFISKAYINNTHHEHAAGLLALHVGPATTPRLLHPKDGDYRVPLFGQGTYCGEQYPYHWMGSNDAADADGRCRSMLQDGWETAHFTLGNRCVMLYRMRNHTRYW